MFKNIEKPEWSENKAIQKGQYVYLESISVMRSKDSLWEFEIIEINKSPAISSASKYSHGESI